MTTKPKIELKNIKLMKSLSEETPCYSAALYVDGKPFATSVTNHGHGGPDSISGLMPGCDLKWLEQAIADTYEPIDMSDYKLNPLPMDLEVLCHTLVWDHDTLQTIKRLTKGKLVFFAMKPGPEDRLPLYTIPLSPEGKKPENLAKLKAAKEQTGAYVLNGLSDDELLAAYKRAN